jgi:hypothetical protein
MYADVVSWIESHYMTCGFKQITGFDCIACGTQRAFVFLLKGDVVASFKMYPALMPILFMFLFLLIHLMFKFKKGGVFLKYNFITVVLLMVINYSLKLMQ